MQLLRFLYWYAKRVKQDYVDYKNKEYWRNQVRKRRTYYQELWDRVWPEKKYRKSKTLSEIREENQTFENKHPELFPGLFNKTGEN
jgi:hypothetical protein